MEILHISLVLTCKVLTHHVELNSEVGRPPLDCCYLIMFFHIKEKNFYPALSFNFSS